MKYGILIKLIVLMAVSPASIAATEMVDKTIKDIIVNLTTGVHFRINESSKNNEGCASDEWFQLDPESTYKKEALSLLLSYEAQNKAITFHLSGCTNSYPKVKYIY